MDDERSLVAQNIEAVREARRLSRKQLADRLSEMLGRRITYLQVYRIEMGKTSVSAEAAAAFANALGVNVSRLYREAA